MTPTPGPVGQGEQGEREQSEGHDGREGPGDGGETARPPLLRELALVTALFLVYKFGRLFANGHETRAFRNADRVWDAERAVHLPGEGTIQQLLLHGEPLIRAANTYYAAVHFPATLAFLVWLYLRRPAHYVWSRRVLALVTGAALALHLLMPLAPPRMLAASGLVDTARVYGPSVYGATPETDSMANQFAAMPSLHFGWALMVAIGLIAATRSRWRVLWLLHPLLTLLVIVGTANHYWFDAIAAAAILGTLGVWVLLCLVLQLRSHADPDERMYGLMATVASAALTVIATGLLGADPDAVVVGGIAVAAAVLARALPLPGPVSLVGALLASAGAGIAAGGLTGLGPSGALLGLGAGVCALVGLRAAAYDYPSRFVHMTAGVALPLTAAAPAVYLLGRALV